MTQQDAVLVETMTPPPPQEWNNLVSIGLDGQPAPRPRARTATMPPAPVVRDRILFGAISALAAAAAILAAFLL